MDGILKQYDILEIKLIFIVTCISIVLTLLHAYRQNNFYKEIWKNLFLQPTNNLQQYLNIFIKEIALPFFTAIVIISLSIAVLINRIFPNNSILNEILPINYIYIVVTTLIYITIKILLTIFLGEIYNKKESNYKYIKINILLIICSSIIILPILTIFPFLILYIENLDLIFFYFLLVIFATALVLKFIFFIKINLKKKFLNYRNFLYFCIVEIIPYFILIKLWK